MEESGERMIDNLFQGQVDDRILAGDQNGAFRLIKKEAETRFFGVSRDALNELRARVLRRRNAPDKDILYAFGGKTYQANINSDGPLFRYPYSYIVYGAVTPFKHGPGSKINIYKRGIEAAKYNDDNVVLKELEKLIEDLEIAEQKKAEKLNKKKLKGKEMVVPREGEEEKKVEKVDVVELEQINEVAKHEALIKKKEDEFFCDFGQHEFCVPFNFSSFRTSGKNCCRCIENDNAGNFQVNKSLVTRHTPERSKSFQELYSICLANHSLLRVESAFPNPNNDGTMVLVCEVVSTLHHYVEAEFQKFAGSCEKVTDIQWWNHISDKFKTIFRDVIQGLRFLYSKTDYACGDLKFSIFVTEDGRGRILPSLVPRNGTKEIIKDIGQLKDVMIAVLAYPFDGKMSCLENAMPLELEWFLNFDFTRCTGSMWFVVNCPFFWTVEERVRFAHVLKKLIMSNYMIKMIVEHFLYINGRFENWYSVPHDVFETILRYHEKRAEKDPDYTNKYGARCDICRFFVAVYGHLNDKMYKKDQNDMDYEESEIEAILRGFYPDFYVTMFECLCLISGDLADEELRKLSGSSW